MNIPKAKVPKEYQIKIKDKTPDGYPKKHHSTLICGSSRSGKTTMIVHLIDVMAPAYKHVLVFSPSVLDPTWAALRKHDNVFFSDIVSNHILHTIFERQKKLHEQDKTGENSMLICIDDYGLLAKVTGADVLKPPPALETVSSGIKQMLDLMLSRGRHFSCSTIVSYHDVMSPSPLQRCNATHYILYKMNDKQLERISPELKCHLSDKEFVKMAHDYTQEPFNFIYCDLRAVKNEEVFHHGRPASPLT